jgi:tetratricopeptide (TPR) repeat protein
MRVPLGCHFFALCLMVGSATATLADEASDKAFYDAFELLKAKKPDQAIVKFTAGLKSDPNNATARFYLGEAQFAARHPKQARVNWQKALDAAPRSEWASQARKRLAVNTTIAKAPTVGNGAAAQHEATGNSEKAFTVRCQPTFIDKQDDTLANTQAFRITIDLLRRLYMQSSWYRSGNDTQSVSDLYKVDDKKITLYFHSSDAGISHVYLDRLTGVYTNAYECFTHDDYCMKNRMELEAKCEKVAVWPFPAKQF